MLSADGKIGETWKSELEVFADDKLVVLVGYVAFDLALVDKIAENALAHVVVHVGLAQVLQYVDKRFDGYLSSVEQAGQCLWEQSFFEMLGFD